MSGVRFERRHVDAKAMDRNRGNAETELFFATFRSPEAWLLKGPPTTTLSASTSTDCGYVTFYGDSPKGKKGTA